MWRTVLDILFPPTPREQHLATCTMLQPELRTVRTHAGVQVLTCADYTTPAVRAATLTLKSHTDPHATELLATLLTDAITEELADTALWEPTTAIVPMPLSPQRTRERGFNQVLHVCRALPDALRAQVVDDVLLRVHDTPPQKTLRKAARLARVQGVFTLATHHRLQGVHVVLVDDVVTTGATLTEAT